MAFDDRGRLWCGMLQLSRGPDPAFDPNQRDRILIFEDSRGTGHFDKRTVFWTKGEVDQHRRGLWRVFCLSAPNLIFIPVRKRRQAGGGARNSSRRMELRRSPS